MVTGKDQIDPEGQPQPLQCLTGLCLLQKQSVCSLFQEQCIQLRRQQEAHRRRAGTAVHSVSTGLCKPPAPWQRLPGTYPVPAVSAQSTLDTILFFLVPRWQMRGLLRHCLCQTSSLGRTALPRVWCHGFPCRHSSQLSALSRSPSSLAHRHLFYIPLLLAPHFCPSKPLLIGAVSLLRHITGRLQPSCPQGHTRCAPESARGAMIRPETPRLEPMTIN